MRRSDDSWLWVALAALVVLMRGARKVPPLAAWGGGVGWQWPVPDLMLIPASGAQRLYRAVVTDPPGSARPDGRIHDGCDILYARKGPGDLVRAYPPGSESGTKGSFAPRGTPIKAARAGLVWSVEKTARGWAVVLDHGKPWATFYQHMESVTLPLVQRGKPASGGEPIRVTMGQVIGAMGGDPIERTRLRHLHFEVWYQGTSSDSAVDPTSAMASWRRSVWGPLTDSGATNA